MSKGVRELISDWLMVLGALVLAGSLFLTWSHQFSTGYLTRYAGTPALEGVPRDPTAWQVYSVVDVLLALLALGLLGVALRGARPARIAVLFGLMVAIAFTVHAVGTPPTRGANLFDPALNGYTPDHPTAGLGEAAALIGLGLGVIGIAVAFTAD